MAEQLAKVEEGEKKSQYRVEDYFCDDKLLDDIDFIFPGTRRAAEAGGKELQQLSNVFAQNILAAFFTATTLHVFARRTAYNTGYMATFGIRLGTDLSDGSSENRIKKAQESLQKTINETEWGKKLEVVAEGTARGYLAAFINDDAGRQAVSQIMNQSAVLIWSSFEILASDIFVYVLNRNASFAGKLLNGENTKKYYREKELASSLAEYNYDLSRHMGDALIQQRRLDDLIAIKNIYGALLDKAEGLRTALNENQLWRLYKTRNLVVHRAGVVDALFQKETGDSTPIGTNLRVSPSMLKDFMIVAGRTGCELIEATSKIFQNTPLSAPSSVGDA